ncbi:hypothetical protein NUSPORA_01175 [Nucleospora cyclopteri]
MMFVINVQSNFYFFIITNGLNFIVYYTFVYKEIVLCTIVIIFLYKFYLKII